MRFGTVACADGAAAIAMHAGAGPGCPPSQPAVGRSSRGVAPSRGSRGGLARTPRAARPAQRWRARPALTAASPPPPCPPPAEQNALLWLFLAALLVAFRMRHGNPYLVLTEGGGEDGECAAHAPPAVRPAAQRWMHAPPGDGQTCG
jgi:hypothetical protein